MLISKYLKFSNNVTFKYNLNDSYNMSDVREFVKTWKQGNSIAIIIPKKMTEKLKISSGNYVEVVLEGDVIRIKKV